MCVRVYEWWKRCDRRPSRRTMAFVYLFMSVIVGVLAVSESAEAQSDNCAGKLLPLCRWLH